MTPNLAAEVVLAFSGGKQNRDCYKLQKELQWDLVSEYQAMVYNSALNRASHGKNHKAPRLLAKLQKKNAETFAKATFFHKLFH